MLVHVPVGAQAAVEEIVQETVPEAVIGDVLAVVDFVEALIHEVKLWLDVIVIILVVMDVVEDAEAAIIHVVEVAMDA